MNFGVDNIPRSRLGIPIDADRNIRLAWMDLALKGMQLGAVQVGDRMEELAFIDARNLIRAEIGLEPLS